MPAKRKKSAKATKSGKAAKLEEVEVEKEDVEPDSKNETEESSEVIPSEEEKVKSSEPDQEMEEDKLKQVKPDEVIKTSEPTKEDLPEDKKTPNEEEKKMVESAKEEEENKSIKEEDEAEQSVKEEEKSKPVKLIALSGPKAFEDYYLTQRIVSPDEIEKFMETQTKPMPMAVRFTGSKSHVRQMLAILKRDFISKLKDLNEKDLAKLPECLTWYPEESLWRLNFDKSSSENETLNEMRSFMHQQTECGNMNKQDALSMIPALLMKVEPHHKILDMRSHPGAKLQQLIEIIHHDEATVPSGFVIGSETYVKKCYTMEQHMRKILSPNFAIVNMNAKYLPDLELPKDGAPDLLKFDRVLADLTSCGDGQFRSNPDGLKSWTCNVTLTNHGSLCEMLNSGLGVLAIGGRLVFSIYTLNPIEGEAVIATILTQQKGTVELVDVSSEIPYILYEKGIKDWAVLSKGPRWFKDPNEVPEYLWPQIWSSMFPPSAEDAEKFGLEKCLRILPHKQDTAGIFIAVLKRTGSLLEAIKKEEEEAWKAWEAAQALEREKQLEKERKKKEKERIKEEKRREAEKKRQEEKRKAEEKRLEEEKRKAEEKRLEEEKRIEMEKRGSEEEKMDVGEAVKDGEGNKDEDVGKDKMDDGEKDKVVEKVDEKKKELEVVEKEKEKEMEVVKNEKEKEMEVVEKEKEKELLERCGKEKAVDGDKKDGDVSEEKTQDEAKESGIKDGDKLEASLGGSKDVPTEDHTKDKVSRFEEQDPQAQYWNNWHHQSEGNEEKKFGDHGGREGQGQSSAMENRRLPTEPVEEEPFVFLDPNDKMWLQIKSFYDLSDDFPVQLLAARIQSGVIQNFFYVSENVKQLCVANQDKIPFVRVGVKVFSQVPYHDVECKFRLAQEGLDWMYPYMRKQVLALSKKDFAHILDCPCPDIERLTATAQKKYKSLETGGIVFTLEPTTSKDSLKIRLMVSAWKSETACRTFIPEYQRLYYLRCVGANMKDYDDSKLAIDAKAAVVAFTAGFANIEV